MLLYNAALNLAFILLFACLATEVSFADEGFDVTRATIVVRDAPPLVERTAATVLVEEVQKRSGVTWQTSTKWNASGWTIAVLSGKETELHGVSVPPAARSAKAEGYGIVTDRTNSNRPVLWIVGTDPRGVLFGVGRVLRNLDHRPKSVHLLAALNLTSSPDYPIRGHQLGYRAQANSYDAWSPQQFDQYIRELAFFGTNSIEGIPFQDTRPTVGKTSRATMNVELSRICERYGQDYWLWVPADFDLGDAARRTKALREHDELFRACPTLTGIFVAGGDPGDNPAELMFPYLADLGRLLAATHPNARVWLSLQGYTPAEQDRVYRWIAREHPIWLGGLVAGPSSPPLQDIRARLPRPYAIRDYPDITHSVRCQFPVPWWDPAFAFTLGRESVNPRPTFFARVFHDTAPFTDGFISYSDGSHDDVNKIIWSGLAWDSSADVNTLLVEYCRVFWGQDIAEAACAGILALERNWDGALATNGSVDATYALWQTLEKQKPNLKTDWRWQMCLLRACYDVYTRKRLIYESRLEKEANAHLLTARTGNSEQAIAQALATLKRAETARVQPELSARIIQLCEDLYQSIGLQTSVPKYQACSSERGCVLDFLHYPLNNRWWLEDECAKVLAMKTEAEKVTRLETLATWANPGVGSFYDDIGNVANSPHEVRSEKLPAPLLDMDHATLPGVMWWVGENPLARARQSWFSDEAWPVALKYSTLNPEADYVIRTTGCGECLLRVNGFRLAPTLDGKKIGEWKEFPVPRGLYRDGTITVTFDPTFEPHLNWRVQSRLTEIWLLKK